MQNTALLPNENEVAYPPTPWRLKGRMIQSLSLIDIERAQQFVPSKMKIVAVYPGQTLGGIYLASYISGSTLVYNELAVVCALTKYAGKIGIWISHIYVDDLSSLKSGSEMWGWPKELAQFTWKQGKKDIINVKTNGLQLCSVSICKPLLHFKLPMIVPAFGSVRDDIRCP